MKRAYSPDIVIVVIYFLIQQGNYYYNLELHVAEPPRKRRMYRIFTHAGVVSDLDADAEAGTKEVRYLGNLQDAEGTYSQLYTTMSGQGYKRVNLLASSRIGSDKAKAQGNRLMQGPSALSEPVQKLVEYLYSEATHKITSALQW